MIALLSLLLSQAGDPLAVRVDAVRPRQNVLHYDIAIAIPDEGQIIRGRTTLRFLVSGGALLRLDFDTAFTVDSVLLVDPHGRTTPAARLQWSFARDGALGIRAAGVAGDTLGAIVVYHGAPTDGLFIRPNVHGERSAFADNWPNRAHHWFPSYDHPSDKATVSFAVAVPRGWRAVANGRLMGVDTMADGRTTWHWAESRPVPVYTMVIGAAHFAVTPIPTLGPPQSVWTFPEDSAFAVTGPFRRAGKIVDAFSRLLGAFPYEKLAHIESSTRFGGMENSSAIFYDEKRYGNRTMREGVVAHETAHQWFGDAVTEADWHHLWLSEGFASYFEPLFYESLGDTAAFRMHMEEERQAYLASAADVARPVIDTAQHDLFHLLNRNNYEKGAWVLHMLRRQIGDSAFFSGLRAYVAAFRDSVALTSDFAAIMERAAGRSLQTFFREWLLQPGYPQLKLATRCADGHLTVTIEQVQPDAWGLWTLSLPATVDRSPTTFDITGPVSTLTYPACGEVTLDPARDYLLEWTRVFR